MLGVAFTAQDDVMVFGGEATNDLFTELIVHSENNTPSSDTTLHRNTALIHRKYLNENFIRFASLQLQPYQYIKGKLHFN